ncbi:hypothetical protein O1611_g2326 [Lasiodiplodia mahajangana]|uniref:Uncharacterized protein n=1 Tax=Lasiodiplodia mahajangana TaxID=1108764 RepID=A0ACC2JUX9_9PEZI|nr:hypothetical protein O1611_g2326 [Lasiodiplodia mahajangana]
MDQQPQKPDSEEQQFNGSLGLKSGTRAYARVMDIKELVQNIRDGRHKSHSYLARRALTNSEFLLLLAYMNSEKCDPNLWKYFNEELRYEYTPSREEFLIRMPSFLHDGLAEEVGMDIGAWLRNIQNGTICSNQKTIEIAECIGGSGTANMTLPATTTQTGRKGPDKAYQHSECDYPGLVIEVAWSQRELDLPQLAEDYIIGSKGEIKTVVGINIYDINDDSKGKELDNRLTSARATFTIWKAECTEQGSNTRVTVRSIVKDKVNAPAH